MKETPPHNWKGDLEKWQKLTDKERDQVWVAHVTKKILKLGMVCTPVLAKLLVDYVCKLRPKEEAMWWANEECFLDLCMAQAREEPLADVLIKHSIIPRNLLLADGASVQMQGPEGRKKSEKSYFRRWKDASWQNRGWEEAKKVYSVGSPLQGDASKVVLQGDSVLVVNGLRGELKPAHIVDTKASEGLPFSAPALHTLIQFDSSKKVYAVLTETIQDSCTPLAGEGGLRRSRRTTAKKVECQKILSPNVVPTVAIMSKGPGNLPPLYFNVFFTNVVFKSVRLNQDHTVTLQEYRSGWEVEVSPSYLQEVLLAPRSFMKEMEASVGQFLRLPVSSRPNNVAASIPSDVTAEESSKVEAVISVKSKETTAGQQEGLLHPTKAQSVQVRSTTSFSGGHTPWSSVDVEFQQNQHEWHCVKDSLANTFWVHGKMTEDVKIQEFAKKGVFELDIPNDAAVGGMTIHKVNAGIQKSLGLRLVKLDHETFNPLHGATWKRTVKEGDASEPLPLFVVGLRTALGNDVPHCVGLSHGHVLEASFKESLPCQKESFDEILSGVLAWEGGRALFGGFSFCYGLEKLPQKRKKKRKRKSSICPIAPVVEDGGTGDASLPV